MAQPIVLTAPTVTGRAQARDPQAQNVFVTYSADFTGTKEYSISFDTVNQLKVFGIARAIFVDNGSNPSPIDVLVTITQQQFTVPANAAGNFIINAADKSSIVLSSVGGATDKVIVTVYNYEVPPNVWYSFGAFNVNLPISTQGSMSVGSTVAGEVYKNPVYMGGLDYGSGLFSGLNVEADGSINVNAVFVPSGTQDVNVTNVSLDVNILNASLDVTILGTVDVTGSIVTVDSITNPVTVDSITNPVTVASITAPILIDSSTPVDVAVTNLPALEGTYIDASLVALTGASETLMAANPTRRVVHISNPNAINSIGVNLTGGVAAIGTAGTTTLLPGAFLTIDNFPPNNAINVIGTAADIVTAYQG